MVSEVFGVEEVALQESRLHGNDARQAAVYLTRELTDEQLAAIGKQFGGITAAAVSKMLTRAEERRTVDGRWDRLLQKLKRRLVSPKRRSG